VPTVVRVWGDGVSDISEDERQRDEFLAHVGESLAAGKCPFSGLLLERPRSRDDHVYCEVCDCFGFVIGK
jgi:hypothetical protein